MAATDSAVFCSHNCPLRTYRGSQSVRRKTLPPSQAYVPTSSPVYKPIRNFQIRLLCLQPGNGTDRINATLSPALLSAHATTAILEPEDGERIEVEYTTLSYSWGSGGVAVEIVCNGQPFVVLQSLETALRHVRRPDEVICVWVDAICIQQASQEEKGIQIQKMFAIYSKASMTIAWLGLESECNGRVLSVLHDYDPDARHSEYCRNGLEALSLDLKQLAERPWFRRTWVRQEVFASRNLYLQAGVCRVSWHRLKSALSHLSKIAADIDPVNPVNRVGLDALQARTSLLVDADGNLTDALAARNIKGLERRPLMSLEKMLRGSTDFQATDDKDFVYGVVSMTAARTETASNPSKMESKERIQTLRIEYNQTTTQTFADTVIYLMKFHNSLDPIMWAYITKRGSDPSAVKDAMPSWVPDWSNMPRWSALDFVGAVIDGPMAFETPIKQAEVAARGSKKDQDYTYQHRPLLVPGYMSEAYVHRLLKRTYRRGRFEVFEESGDLKLACEGFKLGTISFDPRGMRKLMGKLGIIKIKRSSPVATDNPFLTAGDDNKYDSSSDVEVNVEVDNENENETETSDQGPRHTESGWKGFVEYLQSQQGGFINCSFEPSNETTLPNIQYPKTSRAKVEGREVLTSNHIGIANIRKSLTSDGNWTKLFAPASVASGDQVVMLRSMSLPIVLRPVRSNNSSNVSPIGSAHDSGYDSGYESGSGFALIGPLISLTYIREEKKRMRDITVYNPKMEHRGPNFDPWEHFDLPKEDLTLRQYILV